MPVTVLTGYLGAGKTTLLNRILTHEHGLKVAVIVNEFGEVGIDNQLVVDTDEEIFEMNNGCICCTVRGDLIRIIGNLMKRRDRFDHLVIETTGLADPAPVIQTFIVDEDLRDELRLDAVVTLVDLKHVELHRDTEEVQEQLAFVDVLVLNKADLVSDINPVARLLTSHNADVPMQELLGVQAFELERALSLDPGFLVDEHAHEHDDAVGSVALVEERPMDMEKLGSWISELVSSRGPDLFRMSRVNQVDGEFLAITSTGGDLLLLDFRAGCEELLRGNHDSSLDVVGFSGNGQFLMAAGQVGELLLWELGGTGVRPLAMDPIPLGSGWIDAAAWQPGGLLRVSSSS
uniref:GTP-binding protein n=1 Tax=Cyanobium usitatum TaxID=2304190 RepID=UPI003898D781